MAWHARYGLAGGLGRRLCDMLDMGGNAKIIVANNQQNTILRPNTMTTLNSHHQKERKFSFGWSYQ